MAEIDDIDPSELESIANPDDGRSDPDKRFPRREYVGVSGVNNIARGTRVANVYIGGSVPGVDLELNDFLNSWVKRRLLLNSVFTPLPSFIIAGQPFDTPYLLFNELIYIIF